MREKRLRIAVVTPLFPIREEPYRGKAIYHTVRELQELAEVQVFCPLAAYPRWALIRAVKYRYHRVDLTFSPADVRTRYFEYPAIPVLSRVYNGVMCGRYLLPYLRDFQPDIVLNYWLYPEGYGAVLAGRKLGVPVIVGSRGSDLRRGWLTRQLVSRTLRSASLVLTVSEELRLRAMALGAPANRVRSIPNGCDLSIFGPADRAEARRALGVPGPAKLVLFVGWLSESKGLRELFQAFAALAPARPELELACVGEGYLRPELEAFAEQAGVRGRIRFPGPRSEAEVARWMACCDVFCLPSYAEGCPNVVIEALASGRPVVATRVGGIPELVDSSCGVLVTPKDSAELARALAAALERQWEMTLFTRFRRGWGQVADETLEACKTVLNPVTRKPE